MNSNNSNKHKSASDFFPWRRFFARSIDFTVYNILLLLIIDMILMFTNITNVIDLDTLALFLVMILHPTISLLIFEPIMLCMFGTTVGKMIFGIYIRDKDGEVLSYGKAFSRTGGVLIYGLGLFIPIIQIFTLVKSYFDHKGFETLMWEKESEIYLKNKNILAAIIPIALYIWFRLSFA